MNNESYIQKLKERREQQERKLRERKDLEERQEEEKKEEFNKEDKGYSTDQEDTTTEEIEEEVNDDWEDNDWEKDEDNEDEEDEDEDNQVLETYDDEDDENTLITPTRTTRLITRLITTAFGLYIGSIVLDTVGQELNGTSSPMFAGLTLIGFQVDATNTITGVGTAPIIILIGLIGTISIIFEFIRPIF